VKENEKGFQSAQEKVEKAKQEEAAEQAKVEQHDIFVAQAKAANEALVGQDVNLKQELSEAKKAVQEAAAKLNDLKVRVLDN
jgi:Na+/phosphate symporter